MKENGITFADSLLYIVSFIQVYQQFITAALELVRHKVTQTTC